MQIMKQSSQWVKDQSLSFVHNSYTSSCNNDNSNPASYFSEVASLYKRSSQKPSVDQNTPLFEYNRTSLKKISNAKIARVKL